MDLLPIQNKIYEIRGYKVMLDFDLAEIYGTNTANLNDRLGAILNVLKAMILCLRYRKKNFQDANLAP